MSIMYFSLRIFWHISVFLSCVFCCVWFGRAQAGCEIRPFDLQVRRKDPVLGTNVNQSLMVLFRGTICQAARTNRIVSPH